MCSTHAKLLSLPGWHDHADISTRSSSIEWRYSAKKLWLLATCTVKCTIWCVLLVFLASWCRNLLVCAHWPIHAMTGEAWCRQLHHFSGLEAVWTGCYFFECLVGAIACSWHSACLFTISIHFSSYFRFNLNKFLSHESRDAATIFADRSNTDSEWVKYAKVRDASTHLTTPCLSDFTCCNQYPQHVCRSSICVLALKKRSKQVISSNAACFWISSANVENMMVIWEPTNQ
jgi:hypothetical protein